MKLPLTGAIKSSFRPILYPCPWDSDPLTGFLRPIFLGRKKTRSYAGQAICICGITLFGLHGPRCLLLIYGFQSGHPCTERLPYLGEVPNRPII